MLIPGEQQVEFAQALNSERLKKNSAIIKLYKTTISRYIVEKVGKQKGKTQT